MRKKPFVIFVYFWVLSLALFSVYTVAYNYFWSPAMLFGYSELIMPLFILGLFSGNVCDQCGKSYKHKSTLNAHKKYECGVEPKFTCNICFKKFKVKSNYKAHYIVMHGNQPSI